MTTNHNDLEAAIGRAAHAKAMALADRNSSALLTLGDISTLISAASARGVADGWQPIETMPSGKWVFVYVPGVSGSGLEAIKKPDVAGAFWAGRIISLQTGREITRATHWRAATRPPEGSPLSDNSLYAAPSSPGATPEVRGRDANGQAWALIHRMSLCLPEEIEVMGSGCAEAYRSAKRLMTVRTPPAAAGEGNPDANDMAEADAEVERILAMSDEEVMEGVTPEEIAKMRRDIDRLSRTFAAGRRTGFIAGRDAAADCADNWGATSGKGVANAVAYSINIAAAIRAIEPGERVAQ